jgi:hypothetical protein
MERYFGRKDDITRLKKIKLTFIVFITDTIAGVGKQFNII